MNIIYLKRNKKTYTLRIPADWNELNKELLLLFCRLIHKQILPEEIRLRLLLRIMQQSGKGWHYPAFLFNRLRPEQKARLNLLLLFLFERISLTENKLFKIGSLYGPEDNFKNLRFGEFIAAEQYAEAFRQTEEIKYLQYLSAVLYRPKRADYDPESPHYKGDIREDFNQFTIKRRFKKTSRWPAAIHMANYFFFLGCRKELESEYGHLFGHASEAGAADPQESGSRSGASLRSGSGFDWLDFLRHLPAAQFGTLEEIERQQIHAVLHLANRMMAEAKQQKQELKLQK